MTSAPASAGQSAGRDSPTAHSAGARILAFGGYQPANVVTNDDLAATVDTSDEWIRSRVGIVSRRIAGPDETVADMAVAPAARRWPPAGCPRPTSTWSSWPPAARGRDTERAAVVAYRLGIVAPGAYDLNAACAGFCYALANAIDSVRAGTARHVLVIGAEKMTAWIDWTDRSTCIIFADGAGAAVVGPVAGRRAAGIGPGGVGQRRRHGRQDHDRGPELLHASGGPGGVPLGHHRAAPDRRAGVRAGRRVAVSELSAFVPHQANLRIIEAIARKLGVPASAWPTTSCTPGTPPRRRSRWRCRGWPSAATEAGFPGPAARIRRGLCYAAQVITVP
jgi:3-oxoacyl-[acyl-carrier-protein] synthase-3